MKALGKGKRLAPNLFPSFIESFLTPLNTIIFSKHDTL